MSLKDEKRHEDFSRLLWLDMVKYKDVWFLENWVPTLGEVRGKAIIMGRFWCSKPSSSIGIIMLTLQVQMMIAGTMGWDGVYQAGVHQSRALNLVVVEQRVSYRIGMICRASLGSQRN